MVFCTSVSNKLGASTGLYTLNRFLSCVLCFDYLQIRI